MPMPNSGLWGYLSKARDAEWSTHGHSLGAMIVNCLLVVTKETRDLALLDASESSKSGSIPQSPEWSSEQ